MHIITYIAIGLFVGFIIGLMSMGAFWTVLGLVILIIIGLACADWSGQGDGREGCNRHTSCNH